MSRFAESLGTIRGLLDRLDHEFAGGSADDLRAMSDDELLDSAHLAHEIARRVELFTARCAAEVARRSQPSLGDSSLAAKRGHLNATGLLREITRTGYQDAARRIRVGKLISADGENSGVLALEPLADAVASGFLGIEAADHVIRALAPLTTVASTDELRSATATLITEVADLNADEVGKAARSVRDTLGRSGVADRESRLRSLRSLRRSPVQDGMRRVSLLLDPESDSVLSGALDAVLSPRLGGPRFTDAEQHSRAARIRDDDRSTEQLALDVLVDLVRIGVECDDGTVLGSVKPAVRVTVSLHDLTAGLDELGRPLAVDDSGVAWLEGHDEPVSVSTARRFLCEQGALPIILSGSGEPLDLGRSRRLFTSSQRVALANRDGGCRWPGCDRPPSWCEAHHINPFKRSRPGHENGRTNLDEGLLLCRRHHMLLHNHGWWIERAGRDGPFQLIPPPSVDAAQRPRSMPSKVPGWLTARRTA
jgi:hypothetical protein